MSTRWENVVNLARELDAALARGSTVDGEIVSRLARAVLDFQKELSNPGSTIIRPTPPKT
jgi:hypothetical protein